LRRGEGKKMGGGVKWEGRVIEFRSREGSVGEGERVGAL
jgi:hypothetical protein